MGTNSMKNAFVDYVFSFYGKDGLYPMGATIEQIILATAKLLNSEKEYDFAGDSVDRERVRDILISEFGLQFPTGG
jgi:hypothetical protein